MRIDPHRGGRSRPGDAARSVIRSLEGALRAVPLFSGLRHSTLARLSADASLIEVAKGASIYRRGDASTGLYTVVEGHVKLTLQTTHGDERVVQLAGPGRSFGEASAFLGLPHRISAEAVIDSRLLHVPGGTLLEAVRDDAQFALACLTHLSRHLYQLTSELENHVLRSGTERVIGYLLQEAPRATSGDALLVTLPVKKGIIASRLNLTQEHFSRILHDLTEARLIAVEGRSVRIADAARLSAYGAQAHDPLRRSAPEPG